MSSKNILGLPPLNSDYGFDSNPQLPDTNNKLAPKGDIREINTDIIRRRVIIDAVAGKAEYAFKRAAEMDEKALTVWYQRVQTMVAINEDAQGKPYQAYTEAMCERMIQTMSIQTMRYINTGAERIGYEVYRSLLSEDKPRGLFNRR